MTLVDSRPGIEACATQSPSGRLGANTWTRPIALLATPATTSAMQNALKARSPRPARETQALTATASAALSIVPAEESESDHGAPAQSEAPSAARIRIAMAPSKASDPGERGRARCASPPPRIRRKPPQPTNAAA